MTNSEQIYWFYNRSAGYRRRLENAGWRPEYGAVLGALQRHRPPDQARGPALDFGCGVGDLAATLARAGHSVTGADISLPFLDSARSRYPDLSFVALGPGPELPFAGSHFALVTAINTIEHVANPKLALKEMARVLRPGGLIAMTFPNLLSPLRPLKRFLTRSRRPRYGPESGDSPGHSLKLLLRNIRLLAGISLTGRVRFLPRPADFANAERYRLLGYGADYDAVWLANPLDVAQQLRDLGLQILEMRGIPGAAEHSRALNQIRVLLPAALTSPILLIARRPAPLS